MRYLDQLPTRVLLALMVLLVAAGAMAGDDRTATRKQLRNLRTETLNQLYKEIPETKTQIRKAAGYGVFEVAGAHIFFVGGGGGRGVVRDNLTGRDTFMKMASISGGLGIGVKDTRTVLIFENRQVLKKFLDKGWAFGGEAEATAKIEGKGGTAGEWETPDGIKVYQLNSTGLMARGTVVGTKFWQDDELN